MQSRERSFNSQRLCKSFEETLSDASATVHASLRDGVIRVVHFHLKCNWAEFYSGSNKRSVHLFRPSPVALPFHG